MVIKYIGAMKVNNIEIIISSTAKLGTWIAENSKPSKSITTDRVFINTKSESALCRLILIFKILIRANVIPKSTVIAMSKKNVMLKTTLALLLIIYAISAGIIMASSIIDNIKPAIITLNNVL